MDLRDHEPKIKKIKLKGDEESTTNMENLPREIIQDILSRLPVTSLVQFKLVCKTWKGLSQDPLLPNIHLSKTAQDSPYLIFHSDYPLLNRLLFVELPNQASNKDKVKRFRLPFWESMPDFDVIGSCNGLMCLSDSLYKEPLRVYNPFTRDFLELPLPESKQYINRIQEVMFGFGFEPARMEYKIIKIVYYTNSPNGSTRRITCHHSEVQILTLGSPAWRSLGKVPYLLVGKTSETLVNGRLHWVTKSRRYRPSSRLLVAFDLASEQFQEVPRPEGSALRRSDYQVMVLGGCLSAIVRYNRKLEIWVMKTYNVKESWVKEFNIGAYLPKGLKQNVNLPNKIWRNVNEKITRVLCILKSGEILLECRSMALVAYDPKKGKFRDIVLERLPEFFQTYVHVGSLSWIDTHTHID